MSMYNLYKNLKPIDRKKNFFRSFPASEGGTGQIADIDYTKYRVNEVNCLYRRNWPIRKKLNEGARRIRPITATKFIRPHRTLRDHALILNVVQ